MRLPGRRVVVIAAVASLLLALLLFWPFLAEKIFLPLVAALWLFLRIFALSVDQSVLWILAVLAAIVIFFIRGLQARPRIDMPEPKILNSTLRSFEMWRFYFLQTPRRPADALELARSLTQVLVTIYASRKRIAVDYSVWEAFERREIAIPASVHAFLFGRGEGRSGRRPRRLGPRASRRYSVEFDKALGETLDFLENFAEVKDEGHVGD